MDVQPIATKEGDSDLGTGVTRVLDGVVMMLTGTDEGGVQIGEFGSSEGYWMRTLCGIVQAARIKARSLSKVTS